jgi:hypothetical protein
MTALVYCEKIKDLADPELSVRQKCAYCGEPVWLAVETIKQIKAENGEDARIFCGCPDCLPDYGPRAGKPFTFMELEQIRQNLAHKN